MGLPEIERQNRPLIVGHRGAAAQHPENTLDSFEAAIAAGADIVELDVRLTADGVPVVLHDADVGATTDGTGFVHHLTLAEVKRLDASGGRGSRAEVPTLRESLELMSGRVGVDLEVKNLPGEPGFDSPREEAARACLSMLDEVSFAGDVLVSSFNWLSIEHVRRADPGVSTGFLTTASIDAWAALRYVRDRGHAYVLPHVGAILEEAGAFVRRAHDEGVRVGTWTVDDPAEVERLFAAGVDAVATNDPGSAVAARERWRPTAP